MRVILNVKFERRQIVYLVTDTEQKPRIVTGYKIRMNGSILYILSCGIMQDSEHFECEISDTKDTVLATTN